MKKVILISGCLLSMVLFMGALSSAKPECPPDNGELIRFPNKEDPSTYYECIDGVAELMECPEGLVFDAIKQLCDILKDSDKDTPEAYCRCKKDDECEAGMRVSLRPKCGNSHCNLNDAWCSDKE